MKLHFTISKEVSYTYWLQSMVDWIWFFNKHKYEFYEKKYGKFNEKEKDIFESLRDLLDREDTGYLLLWDLYQEKIKDPEEIVKAKNELAGKFDKIWSDELSGLQKWQDTLQNTSFDNCETLLNRVKVFFNSDFDFNKLNINLLINADDALSAHVKIGYDNILLGISGVPINEKDSVIETLVHEIIHKIEYVSSSTKDLSRAAYKQIIEPNESKYDLVERRPSFGHLMRESIATSIATCNPDRSIYKIEVLGLNHEDIKVVARDNKNFARHIRVVASRLRPLTEEYLKDGRAIDRDYADRVAKEWDLFYKDLARGEAK